MLVGLQLGFVVSKLKPKQLVMEGLKLHLWGVTDLVPSFPEMYLRAYQYHYLSWNFVTHHFLP
jgi:hypothetical protein